MYEYVANSAIWTTFVAVLHFDVNKYVVALTIYLLLDAARSKSPFVKESRGSRSPVMSDKQKNK
eukprot:6202781-Pleurochrysis_carterae.AAC.1